MLAEAAAKTKFQVVHALVDGSTLQAREARRSRAQAAQLEVVRALRELIGRAGAGEALAGTAHIQAADDILANIVSHGVATGTGASDLPPRVVTLALLLVAFNLLQQVLVLALEGLLLGDGVLLGLDDVGLLLLPLGAVRLVGHENLGLPRLRCLALLLRFGGLLLEELLLTALHCPQSP